MQRALQQIRATLDPPHKPFDALAHYLLGILQDPRVHMQSRLLQQAAARWPDDAELRWFAPMACGSDRACASAAATRLADAEPANAAALLPLLNVARRNKDASAYSQALARVRQASGHDSYTATAFVAARDALKGLKQLDSCQIENLGLARYMLRAPTHDEWLDSKAAALITILMPPYGATGWCNPKSNPAITLNDRQNCERLLQHMAGSETIMERMIALGTLKSLAQDPQQVARLQREIDILKWLNIGSIDHYQIRQSMMQGEYTTLKRIAMEQGRWPPPEQFDAQSELFQKLDTLERKAKAFFATIRRSGRLPETNEKQP